MNRTEIKEKLTEIFRNVFDDESIALSDSMTVEDVEDWDSLSHITLISEIEDAFDIKFSMKNLLDIKNVGNMMFIIRSIIERG